MFSVTTSIRFFFVAVVMLSAPIVFDARAQLYPERPVRLIAPFTPGGNVDVQARIIAQKLSAIWDEQIIVDNRPGAGGTLGVNLAAKALPDGHTMVFASFGNILVGPALYKKLPYDPITDLTPIILVSEPPGVMVVNRELPANSVKEFIAYATAQVGKVNYGSAGSGTWNHLFAELFNASAKIQMTHIPYKGVALAVTDLIGGRVQVVFSPFPTALPHVRSGRLHALAVTGPKRSLLLPNVPTVSESGLPGYVAASWFAILGPAGIPRPVVSKVNRDINRVFSEREVRKAFAAEGADPVGGSPEDLAKSMRKGIAKWGSLVRSLDLQL